MGEGAKEFAKRMARAFLGEYSIYCIYAQSVENVASAGTNLRGNLRLERVDGAAIDASPDPLIREQSDYAGFESRAYACFESGRIVGVCFYWFGSRYLQRNFWPLKKKEAKLVQIISLPEARGRGVATALIDWSSRDMGCCGFERLYARIWHSNTPSLRAFERAGWTEVAVVIELNPFRQRRAIRMRLSPQVMKWRKFRS